MNDPKPPIKSVLSPKDTYCLLKLFLLFVLLKTNEVALNRPPITKPHSLQICSKLLRTMLFLKKRAQS